MFAASESCLANILVLIPFGKDTWARGVYQAPILYTAPTSGISTITLLKGEDVDTVITTHVASAGVNQIWWPVPANQPVADDYRIQVVLTQDGGGSCEGVSFSAFSILTYSSVVARAQEEISIISRALNLYHRRYSVYPPANSFRYEYRWTDPIIVPDDWHFATGVVWHLRYGPSKEWEYLLSRVPFRGGWTVYNEWQAPSPSDPPTNLVWSNRVEYVVDPWYQAYQYNLLDAHSNVVWTYGLPGTNDSHYLTNATPFPEPAQCVDARKTLMGGLSDSLSRIDSFGLYPQSDVVVSTGSAPPYPPALATSNALNFVPGVLHAEAQTADAGSGWVASENGEFAYMIVNCSGLLDASTVGGGPARGLGTNVTEIDISGLSEVTSASSFFDSRTNLHVRYDTLQELHALQAAGGLAGWPSNLFHYSKFLSGRLTATGAVNFSKVDVGGSVADLLSREVPIVQALYRCGYRGVRRAIRLHKPAGLRRSRLNSAQSRFRNDRIRADAERGAGDNRRRPVADCARVGQSAARRSHDATGYRH
jgi:hypothetical protein